MILHELIEEIEIPPFSIVCFQYSRSVIKERIRVTLLSSPVIEKNQNLLHNQINFFKVSSLLSTPNNNLKSINSLSFNSVGIK